ncbi:MAG: aminoacetone oxidase family FAD-binding enzyme, partial [Lentisphaerae bacterium]|nr:aminoacetone oxidase family FAD-binding enzyme [Lentisphaerota bacterium]
YPATGSTGDGYRFAESVGHVVIPVRPALIPLITEETTTALSGLGLRNVNVRMILNGKKKREAFGEVAFMNYGIGGPVILTISGDVVDALRADVKVDLSIDLKPALSEAQLDARLLRDFTKRGGENIESVLRGLLPRELVRYYMKHSGLGFGIKAGSIKVNERKRFLEWLKDFRLHIVGHRPIAEAIITAGGVDTDEIVPNTMESRLVHGLYFAGEVLNIHADTGGYNLQAAFSTGWLAGVSAAGGNEE